MKKTLYTLGLFATTSIGLISAWANTPTTKDNFLQTVIAPSCFFENSPIYYKVLAKKEDLLLVQANNQNLMQLREQKSHSSCGKYRDISDTWNHDTIKLSPISSDNFANKILSDELQAFPKQIMPRQNSDFTLSHSKEVQELLSYFNQQEMWDRLLKLTSFTNRYANSQSGVDAAKWIKEYAETTAKQYGHHNVTTEFVKTGFFYEQPSVVVKIPGTNDTLDAVLLSGHMDTLSGNKPGADDDGSGSSTALEVMRAVLASGMKFERTIYFAWYAAEEQGLVGSGYVAKKFSGDEIKLAGVLHFDMTGYQKNPENKIYMLDDYVDADLSNFVSTLAETYVKVEVGHTKCGYACSDHASWKRNGYRAAATLETSFPESSPYIHQSIDTPDKISADHMARFAKIGLAFVAELANPL